MPPKKKINPSPPIIEEKNLSESEDSDDSNSEITEEEDIEDSNSEITEDSENTNNVLEDEQFDNNIDENFVDDEEHHVKVKSNKCYQENYEEEEDDANINLKNEDGEILIGNYEEIIDYQKDSRITKPILTKYEKTRCLGLRATQLIQGSKPMIKNAEHLTPMQIAYLELKNKTLPLIIYRPIPNAKDEVYHIHELEYNFDSDDEEKIKE